LGRCPAGGGGGEGWRRGVGGAPGLVQCRRGDGEVRWGSRYSWVVKMGWVLRVSK